MTIIFVLKKCDPTCSAQPVVFIVLNMWHVTLCSAEGNSKYNGRLPATACVNK